MMSGDLYICTSPRIRWFLSVGHCIFKVNIGANISLLRTKRLMLMILVAII